MTGRPGEWDPVLPLRPETIGNGGEPACERTYEVIVVGCGGIGSAAAYWLARRAGKRCPGDRAVPPSGTSGAARRTIPGSSATPTMTRTTPRSPRPPTSCGPSSRRSPGSRSSSRPAGWTWRWWERPASRTFRIARCRWRSGASPSRSWARGRSCPAARSSPCRRTRAGSTRPKRSGGCRKANAVHVALARLHGAAIRDQLPVRAIRPAGGAVEVVTDEGVFSRGARRAGGRGLDEQPPAQPRDSLAADGDAGAGDLFRDAPLREFAPDRFPIWIWRAPEGFYGFPIYGEVATKAGQDVGGEEVTAETRTFEPNPRSQGAARPLPGGAHPALPGPRAVHQDLSLHDAARPPLRHRLRSRAIRR